MCDGDNLAKVRPDTVTFMGTIVCFRDLPPHKMVHPSIPNDTPDTVYVLIDGQQRMTVCLMFSVLLHDYLRTNKTDKPDLAKQRERVMQWLEKMLFSKEGVDEQVYFPRLIRGPIDIWSSTDSSYKSPISALISSYTDFFIHTAEQKDSLSFEFTCEDREFIKCYERIQRYIKILAANNVKDSHPFTKLPNVKKLFDFPDEEKFHKMTKIMGKVDFFDEDKPVKLKKQESIARIVLMSTYFINKLLFIKMITNSDDYAYRIFDSLNTTGDPLTAFETFRPNVIKSASGASPFHGSPLRPILDEIDLYLNNLDKNKQDIITKLLLISFALAENGKKLSKNLSVQRTYLNNEYKTNNHQEFLSNLLNVMRVFQSFNADSPGRILETQFINKLSDPAQSANHDQLMCEARFCLNPVIDAKHSICIPLISRFYSKFTASESSQTHSELCQAICATTAFLALWRHSRHDTDNIDAIHRRIMRWEIDEKDALNFCRQDNEPDIAKLLKEYKRLLTTKNEFNQYAFENADEWISLAHKIPLYKKAKYLAKFILLLSAYSTENGRQTPGSQALFDHRLWNHIAHSSIEHIIPQSQATTSSELEKLDCIGNLTLLPVEINSFIKDASWDQRRSFYSILSAQDKKEMNQRITESKKTLSLTSENIEKLMDIYQNLFSDELYLPYLDKISRYEEFSVTNIEDRGKKLLKNAWHKLSKWIQF